VRQEKTKEPGVKGNFRSEASSGKKAIGEPVLGKDPRGAMRMGKAQCRGQNEQIFIRLHRLGRRKNVDRRAPNRIARRTPKGSLRIEVVRRVLDYTLDLRGGEGVRRGRPTAETKSYDEITGNSVLPCKEGKNMEGAKPGLKKTGEKGCIESIQKKPARGCVRRRKGPKVIQSRDLSNVRQKCLEKRPKKWKILRKEASSEKGEGAHSAATKTGALPKVLKGITNFRAGGGGLPLQ